MRAIQEMSYKRKIVARSCSHCCSGKQIIITYSECVFVTLGIQHAMRMRRIILPPVARLAVPYFSTLTRKLEDFRKRITYDTTCVLICVRMFVTFLIRRTEQDVVHARGSSSKASVFLVTF
jgi:hypothetical protein